MNSKERFLTALEHSEPDRVPIFANLTPQVSDRLGNELGLPGEPVLSRLSQRVSHNQILTHLGNDAIAVSGAVDDAAAQPAGRSHHLPLMPEMPKAFKLSLWINRLKLDSPFFIR